MPPFLHGLIGKHFDSPVDMSHVKKQFILPVRLYFTYDGLNLYTKYITSDFHTAIKGNSCSAQGQIHSYRNLSFLSTGLLY